MISLMEDNLLIHQIKSSNTKESNNNKMNTIAKPTILNLNKNTKKSFELDDADYNAADDDGLLMMNNDFYNDDFYDYKDTFINHSSATTKTNKNNQNQHINGKVVIPSTYNNNNNNRVATSTTVGAAAAAPTAGAKAKNCGIEIGEIYEDEDLDEDDDNYFTSGPLAVKKTKNDNDDDENNNNNDSSKNSNKKQLQINENKKYYLDDDEEEYNDELNLDESGLQVDNSLGLDGGDSGGGGGGEGGGCFMNGDLLDDEEPGADGIMMDTFFKRVDSLDIVKPKKAKIVHNYLLGESLGDGSYGKVKECLDLRSLCRRAVKIINLKMVSRKIPRGVENVRKEISIMKRLNHKNVIKLYDTFEKGTLLPPVSSREKKLKNESSFDNKKENSSDADAAAAVAGGANNPNNNNSNNRNNNNLIGQDYLLATTAAMVNNIEKPPKLYIFMDYCMTSLEKLLKYAPDQRLRNWQANYYFKQLIEGLEYLHSLNIIHNDIKPGNLLITCDDVLKICDFSISAQLDTFYEYEYLKEQQSAAAAAANSAKSNDNKDDEYNRHYRNEEEDEEEEHEISPHLIPNNYSSTNRFPILQCTPMFQCPEMLDENMDELMILRNACKIDIWSCGITLYQLTTGSLPMQGQTIHQLFENIRSSSNEIKIPDFIDRNLANLLRNMLNRDPIKRWSIKEIRDSEWFKKKHPLVKEDLARLPDDVINNEYSTFRMISYLEKLCQTKNDEPNNYYFSDEFNNGALNGLNLNNYTVINSDYNNLIEGDNNNNNNFNSNYKQQQQQQQQLQAHIDQNEPSSTSYSKSHQYESSNRSGYNNNVSQYYTTNQQPVPNTSLVTQQNNETSNPNNNNNPTNYNNYNHNTINNNISNNNNNGKTQSVKQFTQATKLKRSHCLIM